MTWPGWLASSFMTWSGVWIGLYIGDVVSLPLAFGAGFACACLAGFFEAWDDDRRAS